MWSCLLLPLAFQVMKKHTYVQISIIYHVHSGNYVKVRLWPELHMHEFEYCMTAADILKI